MAHKPVPLRGQCSYFIPDEMEFGERQCSKGGTKFEEGKWWCFQHAPSSVKARRERQARVRLKGATPCWTSVQGVGITLFPAGVAGSPPPKGKPGPDVVPRYEGD